MHDGMRGKNIATAEQTISMIAVTNHGTDVGIKEKVSIKVQK